MLGPESCSVLTPRPLAIVASVAIILKVLVTSKVDAAPSKDGSLAMLIVPLYPAATSTSWTFGMSNQQFVFFVSLNTILSDGRGAFYWRRTQARCECSSMPVAF